MIRNNLAILFGLFVTVTGCNDTKTDLTSPEPEARGSQSVAALAGNTWATKARMHVRRARVEAAAINNLVYVVGGWKGVSGTSASSTLQVYDLSTDSWSPRARMPNARYGVNGVSVINGRLYVAGGVNGSHANVKTLFVYDPATDSWVQRASMPVAGSCGAQGVIGGQLYVYVGCTNTSNGHRFVRYDPTADSWVTLPAPPSRHASPAAAGVINGKFHLAGGVGLNFNPTLTHHVYDPATNSWTSRASLPGAQLASATGVLNEKLYAAGGEDESSTAVATLRVYRPNSNTWATKASMPTPRYHTAGVAVGGLFFVIGGFGRGGPPFPSGVNEAFTPDAADPAPGAAAVTMGTAFFTSERNGTTNPAVDTVAVGGTVTWTLVSGLQFRHNVQSIGSPSFPSSPLLSGRGTTYSVTFSAPGTYLYNCIQHRVGMTGRIVVR